MEANLTMSSTGQSITEASWICDVSDREEIREEIRIYVRFVKLYIRNSMMYGHHPIPFVSVDKDLYE